MDYAKDDQATEFSWRWAPDAELCEYDIDPDDGWSEANEDEATQTNTFKKRFYDAYDEECAGRRACELKLDSILDVNGQQGKGSPACKSLRP